MRLSKSTILMYLNCPLQYKLVRINNVPFTSLAMERGSYFHDIAAKFFDVMEYDNMNPKNFEKILRYLLSSKWEEYEAMAYKFMEVEIERFNQQPRNHYRPKMKEIKLRDEELGLSGVIDRVDYEPKIGKYTIYDYKTGMVTGLKKYMFELTVYGYLFRKAFKKPLPDVGIICIKNARVFRATITEAHVKKMLEIVNEVKGRILREEFYRNKKANCFWCPKNVQEVCKKLKKAERENEHD